MLEAGDGPSGDESGQSGAGDAPSPGGDGAAGVFRESGKGGVKCGADGATSGKTAG